jgi:hypothetical protein
VAIFFALLQVIESLSLCLESCLVGRLNRLIRRVAAPRLQRLAVYVSPDDPELSRMSVLELRSLPLLHLHISNSALPSLARKPLQDLMPQMAPIAQSMNKCGALIVGQVVTITS